jgi:hypothetical protein
LSAERACQHHLVSSLTISPGAAGRLWCVALLFPLAMAPVLTAATVRRTGPVVGAGIVVSGLGVVGGWVRHRSWSWQDAVIVAVLAGIAALSQPLFGAWTLLGGLCAVSLLRARAVPLPWLSWSARPWWIGTLVAVPVGVALGVLNVLSARGSTDSREVGGLLHGLLDAVKAGISEELGMRLCLLALCVYVLGHLPCTRREQLLTYLVLVVPHAAFHFVRSPSLMLDGTISFSVLFGLPLTFLLKRFGLLSAAVAHTIIDALRFVWVSA